MRWGEVENDFELIMAAHRRNPTTKPLVSHQFRHHTIRPSFQHCTMVGLRDNNPNSTILGKKAQMTWEGDGINEH